MSTSDQIDPIQIKIEAIAIISTSFVVFMGDNLRRDWVTKVIHAKWPGVALPASDRIETKMGFNGPEAEILPALLDMLQQISQRGNLNLQRHEQKYFSVESAFPVATIWVGVWIKSKAAKKSSTSWWPFGKKEPKFIEVPNTWGVADGSPFLVAENPDLAHIFSDSNPQPPMRLTNENRLFWQKESQRGIRYALAMAYLAHPDPEVRTRTIFIAQKLDAVGISQQLVDLLADPTMSVRLAAAQALWERTTGDDPDKSGGVPFAIRCLRDEMMGSGMVSNLSFDQAFLGFQTLLDYMLEVMPQRRQEFDRWTVYAWCQSDEALAVKGYELLELYTRQNSFLKDQGQKVGAIGAAVGNPVDREALQLAILVALGSQARDELAELWNEHLRGYVHLLAKNKETTTLIELLNQSELEVCGLAADSLGEMGEADALQALQRVLQDRFNVPPDLLLFHMPDLKQIENETRQKIENACHSIENRLQAQRSLLLPAAPAASDRLDSPTTENADQIAPTEPNATSKLCIACKQVVSPVLYGNTNYCPNCGVVWKYAPPSPPSAQP